MIRGKIVSGYLTEADKDRFHFYCREHKKRESEVIVELVLGAMKGYRSPMEKMTVNTVKKGK